jgi:succinate dehydrogenase / fumarate reductase, cytochrome b subunit
MLLGENDVYSMLILGFQSPLVSFFYLLAVGLLCMHLSHGFSSLLQTLGINTKKLMTPISVGARVLAALVFIGYASIPVAVLTGALKLPPPPTPERLALTATK